MAKITINKIMNKIDKIEYRIKDDFNFLLNIIDNLYEIVEERDKEIRKLKLQLKKNKKLI